MKAKNYITLDANEAVASVAHRVSELIALYPITPASPIGEHCDEWAAKGKPNLWGQVPQVVQMQSEAGAIAAVHGALQAGLLATTFTSSQGLLLMIPNLYKIGGELHSFVLHVAARAVATHALSIFGDHSDVMGCRMCGFAMLASTSVQEAHDFAAIASLATLKSRVPVMHFFDGFRTSHEINKIAMIDDADLRALLPDELLAAHRGRGLTPDHPAIRGTAHNPDTFFQAREAANPFYDRTPDLIASAMKQFGELTGRRYQPFEYVGHPKAKRVVIVMGSAAQTTAAVVRARADVGNREGAIIVRLYRPFDSARFLEALPATVRSIAVLDRTKEPGANGEPLLQDVITTLFQANRHIDMQVIGGRYGLSSKEFTPAMVASVFAELNQPTPKSRFTVGIHDDVTRLSLDVDQNDNPLPHDYSLTEAVFFGLGSDGTVGANKNTIKIIGEQTPLHAQAYFIYDSKKSGAVTVSHLRFGPKPIEAPYLIRQAGFVACHQFNLLERYDVLGVARPGATVLLNTPYSADQVWGRLPAAVRRQIREKKLSCYVINASEVAEQAGMGKRINTVMQVCFFALSGVLPRDQAIEQIKLSIKKTYAKRGEDVVQRNFAAVDAALAHLIAVPIPAEAEAPLSREAPPPSRGAAVASDSFIHRVTQPLLHGEGERLPVSAFPADGTWPVGTSKLEKRGIAGSVPAWHAEDCNQCNQCVLACPHSALRAKVFDPANLVGAPLRFQSAPAKGKEFAGKQFVIQVSAEDCTGCGLCQSACPVETQDHTDAMHMVPLNGQRADLVNSWEFFDRLPEVKREDLTRINLRTSQLIDPLFEFSGACAGCGQTPYIKMLTQLYGDRLLIANATGCSSIYGGNLPTTPYTTDRSGRGPAWSNSLCEDNAEYGLGLALASQRRFTFASHLLKQLAGELGDTRVSGLLDSPQTTPADIANQRIRVAELKSSIAAVADPRAAVLAAVADDLVRKTTWVVGGDGWAYDIGFGGLDHLLSLPANINVLVLDTEVYSNTGGQASKATPLGAVARFAAAGKPTGKKDLGQIAMSYGHAYVASIAFGADPNHTLRVLQEAESYDGPSLVIAYAHCIAHGYDLRDGLSQQKLAVTSGVWPLYRFDPRRTAKGLPPLQVDGRVGEGTVEQYLANEPRFTTAAPVGSERFTSLVDRINMQQSKRQAALRQLANVVDPPTRLAETIQK